MRYGYDIYGGESNKDPKMKQATAFLFMALLSPSVNAKCMKWDHVYITKTDPDTLLMFAQSREDLFLNLEFSISRNGSFPTTNSYYAKNTTLCEEQDSSLMDFPYAVAVGVMRGRKTAMAIGKSQAENIIKLPTTHMLPRKLNPE